MRAKAAPLPSQRLEAWVGGYRPLPGIPDELIAPDGRPRAHWLDFLERLAALRPEEIDRRFASADRHIRDAGVSYRVYGETSERSWPLSHLPLLISESEWRDIAAGVAQRASLIEAVLADVYGEGRLIAEGALPAAAIAGSPDFLRPMAGLQPPGGRYLHLYAADLGRGPDGRWWVLGDRTQAPSGAGYALENRLVLSRAFPGPYHDMNVERLAPFFRAFRAGLAALGERTDPRICLLTSGPYSETYFEQAQLARYLGFLLVEGDDLVMREGRVHVRTVAGLKRADVIWRRIDADFCDPLELNAASRLGVPGLIEAMRGGGVAVANMPGAGLAEARALLGFMPTLAQRVLGEDLKLPNIATWWCGQPRERDLVLRSIADLAIAGAFTPDVPGLAGQTPVIGADAEERERLVAAISARPVDYVGQEVARLSTAPVWEAGRLVPRPFVLRVFAAATPDGWRVMPGGFCRIAERADARIVSMGEGVRSADVWVLAEGPVERASLLPAGDKVPVRRITGNLPSRAADNLFWLGRYLERAEATLRLVRCLLASLLDEDPAYRGAGRPLERLRRLLLSWGAITQEEAGGSATRVAAAALHGAGYGSAASLAQAARRAASGLRERLAADAWQLLNELATRLLEPGAGVPAETEALHRADRALQVIAAVSGLAQENMNRVAGWQFLDTGRRIERAINTCRYARTFTDPDAIADDLDVLLDLVDSQITYRSRYVAGLALAPVRDLVVLDPYNPRSVAFQIERLKEHLTALPSLREDGILEPPRRLVTLLAAETATESAEALDTVKILAIEQKLMALSGAIADRYFLQGPNAPRAEKLTGLA